MTTTSISSSNVSFPFGETPQPVSGPESRATGSGTAGSDSEPYSYFVGDDPHVISNSLTAFEKIAEGACCQLWRASKGGQWYVVKSLKEQYRDSAQHNALMAKEYEVLTQLDSPYVVKVYDYCGIPGLGRCIVMEWIDGITLQQWLHGPATPAFPALPDRAGRRRVARQLIEALTYIHSMQTVHRDLKPSNIMITRNGGQVKLIDFGLSDTDSFAICKQPAGTKGYISPEQRDGRVTDERNDIYSLGVILREMHLGWQWRGIVEKALKPIDRRIGHVTDIPRMLQRRRRWVRALIVVLSAVLLIGVGFVAYDKTVTPRPQFEVVARFQYSNMIFESWGGGLATMRPANHNETTVEVPVTVAHEGFEYKVDELTFHAFRGDDRLQAVIMPGGIHIMKAAFRNCPNLNDIYIKGTPPEFGNAQWPAVIDDVFDASHFSTVRIHVPKTCRAAYASSPWNRFRRYVYY